MLFLSRWDDQGHSADPDRLMLDQRWVSGWACKSAQMCLVIGGFGHISLTQDKYFSTLSNSTHCFFLTQQLSKMLSYIVENVHHKRVRSGH